jgi:curved DNA-binding protein
LAVGYRDYYEVLGVPRGAGDDEIRTAYRKLAREYHPDVNKDPGADDRFKEISEAYEVLRDPEKREKYDRLGANWKTGQDVSGASGFGGNGDGRTDFGEGRTDFGDDGGFSDFFESFFGRRRAGTGGGFEGFSMRGGDQEATLEITLEEAARGGKRSISLADGRDFEVRIPAGVRDGQKIRLAGQGGGGVSGGPAGDLYLRVRVKPHPRFRLEGDDLVVEVPVAPWEAALGAGVPVPTLDRGVAQVKVPAGSSSGRRLRLKGEGMPAPGGRRGDLYAVVRIVVPKRLEPRERELFEELAAASRFDPRQGR